MGCSPRSATPLSSRGAPTPWSTSSPCSASRAPTPSSPSSWLLRVGHHLQVRRRLPHLQHHHHQVGRAQQLAPRQVECPSRRRRAQPPSSQLCRLLGFCYLKISFFRKKK